MNHIRRGALYEDRINDDQNLSDNDNDDTSDYSADITTPALDIPEMSNIEDSEVILTKACTLASLNEIMSITDSSPKILETDIHSIENADRIQKRTSQLSSFFNFTLQQSELDEENSDSIDLNEVIKKIEVLDKNECVEAFLNYASDLNIQLEKLNDEKNKLEDELHGLKNLKK